MKANNSFLYIIVLTTLMLFACKEETTQNKSDNLNLLSNQIDSGKLIVQSEQQEVIEKPFANIDIPFQTFEYNPNKLNQIHLPSGTNISIPSNCFEDENGNPVNDNVTIKYREMHTIDDIILTGIKMDYDGSDFETAGMFEIRAYNEKSELSLKKDKDISVELASYRTGDFDHFYMDEDKKEWTILPEEKVKKNLRKSEKIASLNKIKETVQQTCSIEPREYQVGDDVFDLDYDLERSNGLALFHGAMWIIDGTENDKKNFKRIGDKYDGMSLTPKEECDKYELTLNKHLPNTKKITTHRFTVTPVWKGKEFEKAKAGYRTKINEVRDVLKDIARKKIVAEKEADILRSFSLKGMGIYNCDRIIRYLKLVTVGIALTCRKKIMSWWYITNNKRVAIRYFSPNDQNFKYNPNSENSIIAVVEGGQVAHVSAKDFDSAIANYNKTQNSPLEFELEIEKKPIRKAIDFKNVLATN